MLYLTRCNSVLTSVSIGYTASISNSLSAFCAAFVLRPNPNTVSRHSRVKDTLYGIYNTAELEVTGLTYFTIIDLMIAWTK